MSDLPPLKLVARSTVTRALLESARSDAAGADAKARALASLAAGASVVAVATAPGGGSAGAATTAANSTNAGAAAVATRTVVTGAHLLTAKGGVLAACLGVGLVVFGAAVVERPHASDDVSSNVPKVARTTTASVPADVEPNPHSSDAEPAPLPSTAAPLATGALGTGAPAAPATATTRTKASRPAGAPKSTTSATPPASEAPASAAREQGLRDRLAKLVGVRAALQAHDPERALTMLDELAREDSSSALAEEIMVLRIDALREAGRDAEAAALGRQFLERYPTSAYVTRVRTKSTGR